MICSRCRRAPDRLRIGFVVLPGITAEKRTVQVCPHCGNPAFMDKNNDRRDSE